MEPGRVDFPFEPIDVFTTELTLGNPTGLVHGADSLNEDRMAAFARWTSLSKTTLLLEPTTTTANYRVRIFIAGNALSFAGHLMLGSACA
ncbi:MAG: PhzF family phenazine biosynthesis protein [Paeniglutamicibacter sp.]